MIAHIAGLPLEEALVPLLSGVGSGLVLARAWIVGRTGLPEGGDATMASHRIGTREEWLAEHLELLDADKELTRHPRLRRPVDDVAVARPCAARPQRRRPLLVPPPRRVLT